MGVTVKDIDNFPKIISDLKELKNLSAFVGVSAEPDSDLAIYAGANEFGAVIKSKKAIAKLYYLMVEEGLIDEKKFPIYIWMKSKDKIVIPERSFLRSTFHDESVMEKVKNTFTRILSSTMSPEKALSAAADVLVSAVKSKIVSGVGPGNHPLTSAGKSGQGTLQKSFQLHRSIRKQIVKE
ncbi:MAG: hypothetical protein L6Q54_06340 [Leptospiraceae bacterium]|nr:hypothetical protein [Leptospiraceae bacterium]MCK6380855.1 hypothetical protein [Leptospiraceae bacterium]